MNLNKCERCGCFFATQNSVCPNCQSKDESNINQLKTFLSEADSSVTVESLAISTGISLKNVNRFLQNKDVYATLTNLGLSSETSKLHNISL